MDGPKRMGVSHPPGICPQHVYTFFQAKLVVQEYPLSTITVLGRQNKAISINSMRRAENRYLEILDLMTEWRRNNSTADQADVSFRGTALNWLHACDV